MAVELNEALISQAYFLATDFLKSLNVKDSNYLKENFRISDDIYGEILDELERCFEDSYDLSLISCEEIVINDNRPFFDIYQMNNGEEFGLECAIFNKKKLTDITLESRLFFENHVLRFEYIVFRS